LVSAHGTGTSYNDSAESIALRTTLGAAASQVVVHPFKAVVGHTLGAAGVLETLAGIDAMDRGVLPAAVGEGEREPELTARLLDEAEPGSALRCLKVASAFGGANAALVVEASRVPRSEVSPKPARRVSLLAVGQPITLPNVESLRGVVATDPLKLARMDPLSLLAVSAVSMLPNVGGLPESTGVVVGSAAATLEIDAEFERRRRARGPEPRRFPATSPNLAPGECTIAFSLHGPSHAVSAGPSAALEALLVAHDWVAAGDTDTVVVVAVEQVSDFVAAIWQQAGWPVPASGAAAAVLSVDPALPELPRAALLEAKKLADAGHGALPDAAPGWPAFLAALGRAGC
jgi:3-oxoacyl-[acyl-carrier-protein] synthase-1/3-oxoacyl-[acyl-carrier-protein] synthase II